MIKKNEFLLALDHELDKHSDNFREKWNIILSILPARAKFVSVKVKISTSPEANGLFEVYFVLDGPDFYVLNKKTRGHYELVFPAITRDNVSSIKLNPSDVDFSVNHAINDKVSKWIQKMWSRVDHGRISVPVKIYSDNGCSSKSLVTLF
ncbi:DUF6389 family protein [Endozoicomonadaceae bacterium StTr2]